MKVGIITFHNAINFGAILQCYALQSFLEKELGHNVEVINYKPDYFKRVFFDPGKPLSALGLKQKIKAIIKYIIKHDEIMNQSRKNKELNYFINNNLNLSKEYIKPLEYDYDVIISGSDQIWNLELLNNDTTYLLDFVKTKKRVSYAASFKTSDIDEFADDAYKRYLPLFDFVSVRESNLEEYLKNKYDIDSTTVIDPTLLVNKKIWKGLVKNKRLIQEKYILIYYVNKPVKLINSALNYAEKHNLKVVSLNKLNTNYNYNDFSYASIEEFLNLIMHAEQVFTTSFHGMAFSIIFNKEFYFEVPENSYNNNERLIDLSKKLGLYSRNITIDYDSKPIDWMLVEKRLSVLKEEASIYLCSALAEDDNKC